MTFYGTKYENERGKTNIVLGSVDMESLDTDLPGTWGHIYVGEKRTWETHPDDGAPRLCKFIGDAE